MNVSDSVDFLLLYVRQSSLAMYCTARSFEENLMLRFLCLFISLMFYSQP